MGAPLRFRPEGRSVWLAKDLTRLSDWVFQYPKQTLKEIDASLAQVKAAGKRFEDVSAEDFPLESLGQKLDDIKDEIANGRGFMVMRGLPAEKYTLEELKAIYWGIGSHFGTPMPQSYLGDLIGDIIDLSDEEPDYFRRRGYHSGGPQDSHTDSTDIVSMLSITVAKKGGESRLASAHAVHNLMMDHCPGLLDVLYNGFVMRGTDTDAEAEGRPALIPYRVPVFDHTDGWLNSFFVIGYVKRAVMAGNAKLSPGETAAIEAFRAFSNHPEVVTNMLLEAGDMQFVNNRTVYHGRAEFEDHPEKERRRHLLRLWLKVPEWPRMSRYQDVHPEEALLKWLAHSKKVAAASA